MRRSRWSIPFWTVLAAGAVLWPSPIIGPLDGAPLDGRVEAILIGLVLPSLWWLDRRAISTWWSRTLILSLLLWKVGATALLTQQGLCAAAFAKSPLNGINQGIPIVEPSGALRSWDLRADISADLPTCTAILTRPLPTQSDFPAWFLNVTDSMLSRRDFAMTVRGYLNLEQSRTLTIDATPNMRLSGRVDRQPISNTPIVIGAGTHELDLSLVLGSGEWQFEPRLDGRSLWSGTVVTTEPPRTIDRLVGPVGWIIAPMLVLALIMPMALAFVQRLIQHRSLGAWTVGSAVAGAALALSPDESWYRAAGVLTMAAVAVPVATQLRGLNGAFLLIGVPWLTFFAVRSLPAIGRFSAYLPFDDWLTFQVASHRIYMQGYWLEGGNAVFSFQPLYRWTTGALHLIFGDSSVGEVYWDATCLLIGALLAFHIVRMTAGFRWGVAAGSAVLATYTLSTSWHFIGRGLSEITAAGWAFVAIFFVLRGRRGHRGWLAAAGLCAVLMFYTRLNHLLFAPFLAAFLLPLQVPSVLTAVIRAARRIRPMSLLIFGGTFAIGVVLFALRTWYYTQVFSLFYGTSLPNHDIGLRPWTLLDGTVWAAVAHSLAALFWMNEPPRADLRSIVVAAGALVAVAALLHVPVARRVPAAVVIAAVGATAGSFFVHVHAYPGRISIHLVPLLSALTFTGLAHLRALVARPGVTPEKYA